MKKGFLLGILTVAVVLFNFSCTQAAPKAKARIIDKTNTTFGWEILNDKPPVPTLEVISGPKSKTKALKVNYHLKEGVWVALVRNTKIKLGANEGIRFQFKGSGGTANCRLKFSDAMGTIFGYTLPSGSRSSTWKKVVVPRSGFTYLWGGKGAQHMNWNEITKLEITLDSDEIADMAYTVNTKKPGMTAFYKFEVVNTKGMKLPDPVDIKVSRPPVKLKKSRRGTYLIHALKNTKGWKTMSDEDGKCTLSSNVVILGKKTTQAVKANFNFGEKGVWNAVILSKPLNLSKMQMIKFMFKGKGGKHKMHFKLVDGKNTVFGYELKQSTNSKKWMTVVIPKKSLKYLYGGSGSGKINWSDIQKLEFTLDKNDDEKTTGSVFLRRLQYK